MLWLFVRPFEVYLLDFFCSGIQFYLLLSPYLCFLFASLFVFILNFVYTWIYFFNRAYVYLLNTHVEA